MALPSKQEIEALVSELVDVAKNYTDTPGLNGYVSRAQIIAKSKDLVRPLVTPDMAPNYHGLNISLLGCLGQGYHTNERYRWSSSWPFAPS